jgi:hypothetical protein
MILHAVGGFFKLAFTAKGQRSIVNFEIKIFPFHSRNFGPDEIRICAFKDVYGRSPDNCGRASRPAESLVKQIVDPVLYSAQSLKWFPSDYIHNYSSFGTFLDDEAKYAPSRCQAGE